MFNASWGKMLLRTFYIPSIFSYDDRLKNKKTTIVLKTTRSGHLVERYDIVKFIGNT